MEMKKRSQSASESLQKKSLSISELKKAGIHKENSVSPVWQTTNEAEFSPNKDPFMTCRRSSRVQGPEGLEHQWGPSWTGCCSSLIYKYQLASLHLNITSNMETSSFISSSWAVWTPPLLHVYGHVGSVLTLGKLHRVSWQAIRLRSVLPSDCPPVACQGSYLQKKGSVDIKGGLPASDPAVIRFPANLARGNICPPHWTDSSISSRPY